MGAGASAPYASEKEALDAGKTQAEIDVWKRDHLPVKIMAEKEIDQAAMQRLKEVLGSKDKRAMWKLLNQLKLSPGDKPYCLYEQDGEKQRYDLASGGSVSIFSYVYEGNVTAAIDALSYDTFEQFQSRPRPKGELDGEEAMQQLKEVLGSEDKAAMWELLNKLKLSPEDKPYYIAGSVGYTRYYDIYGGYGTDGPRNDRASIRRCVNQEKITHAISALSHDTFKQFQDFELKLKREGADKEIEEEAMELLREVLSEGDKGAMWKVLNHLKLSPGDKPYCLDGQDGEKQRYDLKEEWVGGNASIRRFVNVKRLAEAIDAMSYDTFEQFEGLGASAAADDDET